MMIVIVPARICATRSEEGEYRPMTITITPAG